MNFDSCVYAKIQGFFLAYLNDIAYSLCLKVSPVNDLPKRIKVSSTKRSLENFSV